MDATSQPPTPLVRDLAAAERFLRILAECGDVTFQTFDDSKEKRWHLSSVLHGDLDGCRAALEAANDGGAGVFVMANAGDCKGRKTENVRAVRALFVDLDGASVSPVLACGVEPHIVVESSPGRWHAYWLCDDCPLDQFGPMQKAIATKFGGDSSVHDLPRVMRLPGFVHRKAEPFVSRLLAVNATQPYALADLRARLRLDVAPAAPVQPAATADVTSILPDRKVREIRSALSFVPADDYEVWLKVGMALHSTHAQRARGLWDEWSQKAFDKYKPADQERTWRNFKDRAGGITLSTLFGLAKQNGWKEPADSDENLRAQLNVPTSATSDPQEWADLTSVPACPVPEFAQLVAHVADVSGLDERGATAVAVSFACALAARRYAEPTHAYVVACAEQDDARLRVAEVTAAMFRAVGHGRMLYEQRIGTVARLYGTLDKGGGARLYLPTDLSIQAESARTLSVGTQ